MPTRTDYSGYFRAVERIASEVGGRPHWGKLHFLDAAALRDRYPRFDEFVALRDKLDPTGVFRNAYLDRVLGTAPGLP
jgi:L-gulonolactone oxidase